METWRCDRKKKKSFYSFILWAVEPSFQEQKKKDELEKYFAADPSERFELIQTLTVKLLE